MKYFNIVAQNVDAVKRLSRSESEILKAEINSYDPAYVFTAAKESSNPDKRYIICPNCGNGNGSDKTPVEVNRVGNVWLYHCFKGNDLEGDLLKIIATENNLNLNNGEDFCKALAVGADIIGYNFDKHEKQEKPKSDMQPVYSSKQSLEEENLILADITDAREHLKELPENQRRALSLETLQHFGVGYIAKWVHPKNRLDDKTVPPSRRIIIPVGNHYNAVALPADRPGMPKNFHKMHAGTMELFNSRVIQFADVVFVVEGEFDAMSIWQASAGKIAVVAVLGAANWRKTFAPYFETCTGKKCIILFDDDDAGKNNSENLRGELIRNNIPAVSKFLYDYLSDADKELFGVKVDANDILQARNNQFLQNLIEKIIFDARADFETVEEEIAAQKAKSAKVETDYLSGLMADLDQSRRLARFCSENVKWLSDDERWLIYSAGVWKRCSEKNSCILPKAAEFSDFMHETAKALPESSENQKKADRIVHYFRKGKNINSAIALLKSCSSILITADDLDRHPNLLNVKNGVIDLETGKLFNAAPLLYLTQQVSVPYDCRADCTRIKEFFSDIQPDEKTRSGLLRWLGYCLTGFVREEKFMLWLGTGANGKGTLSKIVSYLLNDYAMPIPTHALLAGKPIDADRATAALNGLANARFALSEEIPQGAQVDSSLIKNLSGADLLTLRRLYGEYRKVKPTAKINLSGNFSPRLENFADKGLRRRLIVMPFDVTFEGARLNPRLKEELLQEENQRALLKLLVDEAILYHKEGLIISSRMSEATQRQIDQNNFIADFLSEYCYKNSNAEMPRHVLLEKIREKCRQQASRFRDIELVKLLQDSGVKYVRDKNGMKFKGIQLYEDNGNSISEQTACPY